MSELQETAFRLYTSGESYESVRKELGVTKKRVIDLVRAQGEKFLEMADNVKEPENEARSSAGGGETEVIQPQPLPLSYEAPAQQYAVDPHALHQYELELTAIDKKLTMTGYEILIYDVFVNAGYKGTFSDFCREGIHALYSAIPPQGRAM